MPGPIPVIDLFAGPGGLAEGFSQARDESGRRLFRVKLSVEKDLHAHRTLTTRAFYRQFETVPDDYYDYLKGNIGRDVLFQRFPLEAKAASEEAMCAELGKPWDDLQIEKRIHDALKGASHWALIGGPPCQAYSLVGRSRRVNEDRAEFERDPRHTLYREYLKIIARHSPSIFVMENVKGMLSAKLDGRPVFDQILEDLTEPLRALGDSGLEFKYNIHSFFVDAGNSDVGRLEPADYVLKSEEFGVPQRRHRVILMGIRDDLGLTPPPNLVSRPAPSVGDVINDLPRLRSRLGARWGDDGDWKRVISNVIKEAASGIEGQNLRTRVLACIKILEGRLPSEAREPSDDSPNALEEWYSDPKLNVVLNHESRSHMPDDLARYMYCAVFAQVMGRPARIDEFPERLIPAHRNARAANAFVDRFKVQMQDGPSSTITSHISKDGHYFIHPDPAIARSLTVREAARLQTFPDNYLFEGPRTQQYHQVGNAVPPYLAFQIAERVKMCLDGVSAYPGG